MSSRFLLLLLLATTAWAATTPSNRPTRGYEARASGMDFEHDGTFNTAICDGSDTSADEDVDGAGYARDDQCHVDCTSGTDGTSCGSPSSPCKTIQYCLDNSNTAANARWRIGTPETAQIQAVCIKGTCAGEQFTVTQDGAAGTVTRSKTASEPRDWVYPRYPLVVMGWDADGAMRIRPRMPMTPLFSTVGPVDLGPVMRLTDSPAGTPGTARGSSWHT